MIELFLWIFLKEGELRPDCMQVYALTGGLPPIMPTLDPVSIKKRAVNTKKVNSHCP